MYFHMIVFVKYNVLGTMSGAASDDNFVKMTIISFSAKLGN